MVFYSFFVELLFVFTERRSFAESQQQQVSSMRETAEGEGRPFDPAHWNTRAPPDIIFKG